MVNSGPLVLLILDGWGYQQETRYNAIAAAHTPQWDAWWATYPHQLLEASGEAVGLPSTQMGNSEVGHMHIGAGRVIPQDYTRINDALRSGDYAKNPSFIHVISDLQRHQKALHIFGLLSAGGVHSHEDHLFAFLNLCAQRQFNHIYLHLFLDGRDTSPQSALLSLEKLQQHLKQHPVATISSISGRYYAMDRDNRWQRVEPVYRLITEKASEHCFPTAEAAVAYFYSQHISDEFIPPTRIGEGRAIEDGDAVFFFNYRADRARQLTQAFLDHSFSGFQRTVQPKLSHFLTMTSYASNLPTTVAFPTTNLRNTLGEIIANHGLRQLRIAETEKYAHVTFFLNGGSELVFPQENRMLIPSPSVATYDMQPEMSAPAITTAIVDALQRHAYDVIICNFANADMVGHTGNLPAATKAVECLDHCMSTIWQALQPLGGHLLITADHGNAEVMFDDTTQQAHTAHTHQPVPFLFVGEGWHFNNTPGSLVDVAPTVLALLGIAQPMEMTGHSLLVNDHDTTH